MKQPECQVSSDGSKYWYLNGKLHREDGPACEYPNGSKSWYLNDQLHRTDGPALEYANEYKAWWLNDKLHRVDGPAIEYANGYKEWWLNNQKLNSEEAVNDPELKAKYPGLIETMIIYLVHNS
jgi:hypothetical protein